jgi:anti-sigma factor RsiW
MTDADLTLAEQLSALMDGELPEAQARFLRRRLEHDQALRDQWSRMQLASACMKGHPAMPMGPDFSRAVRAALDAKPGTSTRPGPAWLRWGVAASLAVLALALAPRLLSPTAPVATAPVARSTAVPRLLPSPASADLVAVSAPAPASAPAETSAPPAANPDRDLVAANQAPGEEASPLSISSQSPTEFPLVDSGDERRWPRSQVLGAGNDPALEAYLVRHNQMLAGDGLGGFVPYVDVVASDAGAAAGADPATSSDAPATDSQ